MADNIRKRRIISGINIRHKVSRHQEFAEMASSMQEPVLFIQTKNTGDLEVSQDALVLLHKVQNPLVAIAIAGKYRTGKSFLMNKIFGKSSGFPLGSTIQSQTKGIWIWIRPHPTKKDTSLILLDTEGLYDVEKGDATHDYKMLSLAILLSSCFVFNVLKSIDDALIQQLHLVSKLVEELADKSTENLAEFFPNFVMVVRDFDLTLEINGKPCSSDEYLEWALTPRSKKNVQNIDYNLPRCSIAENFQRRKCFVMPKPVNNDDKLKALETVESSELTTEFVQQSDIAVSGILNVAETFNLNKEVINGKDYAALAKMYVDALNKGKIPNIESTFDGMRKIRCQQALESSMQIYKEYMEEHIQPQMPVLVEDIDKEHIHAKTTAEEKFQQMCLYDTADVFANSLKANIEGQLKTISDKNCDMSLKACDTAITQSFEDIQRKLDSGFYLQNETGLQIYKNDIEKAVSDFKSTQKLGPLAESTLNEKLEKMKNNEHVLTKFHEAMTVKTNEIATIKEKTAQQNQQFEDNVKSLTEQMNVKLKEKDNQLLKLTEERDSQKVLVYERDREIETTKQQVEAMKLKIQNLEELNSTSNEAVQTLTAEIQKHKATAEQLSCEIKALSKQNQDLLAEHNKTTAAHKTQIDQLNNTLQARNNEVATLRRTDYSALGYKLNSKSNLARKGSTGRYYCGGMLESRCGCCDGHCGPTNGHNCQACAQLK